MLRECVSLPGTQRPHQECSWGHLPAFTVGASVNAWPDLGSVFPLEGVDEEVAREPTTHLFRGRLRERDTFQPQTDHTGMEGNSTLLPGAFAWRLVTSDKICLLGSLPHVRNGQTNQAATMGNGQKGLPEVTDT